MKKKFIILKQYKRDRDSDLSTTAKRVVEKSKNNPKIPNPPEALDKLEKLIPEYDIAVVNARGRDKEMVSIKKALKAEIIGLLKELDSFITTIADGDETLLLTSGFGISGQSTAQPMPDIVKLDVVLGPPGEVTISVKQVRSAKAYLHQYTTEPPTSETVWITEGSSDPECTFQGLKSYTKYWFRIIAIGRNNQKVYSPVDARVIQ
ncbi:fibronectin type III domain-containing protein [Niastella sp. OAS944]|uniref:fibronectin type III domain-containing protein n=1 Tax=Niastella sp. OAS944 TaxID=2664089 RepID=UPI0034748A08|nr:hypothetical protein [Chitinophagaceae bacterium OAS944]